MQAWVDAEDSAGTSSGESGAPICVVALSARSVLDYVTESLVLDRAACCLVDHAHAAQSSAPMAHHLPSQPPGQSCLSCRSFPLPKALLRRKTGLTFQRGDSYYVYIKQSDISRKRSDTKNVVTVGDNDTRRATDVMEPSPVIRGLEIVCEDDSTVTPFAFLRQLTAEATSMNLATMSSSWEAWEQERNDGVKAESAVEMFCDQLQVQP